jgi:mxaJ protein
MNPLRIAALALPLVAASTYHAREAQGSARQRTLRVCADPNNLPFSNRAGQGLENRLVEIVAREMNARVEYTWWAQRRGFIRNTLRANLCDVVAGVPMSFELVMPTRPYYRSSYVFLRKAEAPFDVRSFDDSALKTLRIGVHFIGDDGADTPPAHALARRGLARNVTPFSIYGDYREPNPPARIIEALEDGRIDLAVVWGPLAGYFGARNRTTLALTPVRPQVDNPFLPMVFDISMGVRREDTALRDTLDAILARRAPSIDSLLAAYHVPRLDRRATQ